MLISDACSPNPCQNSGTCSRISGGYTCSCPNGYAGTNCLIDIDECQSSPCLNAGSCKDGVNSYTCTCRNVDGFSGERCQIAALGASCTLSPTYCGTSNSFCRNSKCWCGDNFYDTNGKNTIGGACADVTELKVTGITFSQVMTTQLTVSWTPPVGKTSYINKYVVEWKFSDNTGSDSKDVSTNTATTLSGLTPGKTYIVNIISLNDDTEPGVLRTTSSSNQHAAKPGIPGPGTMNNLDLDVSDSSIVVRWSAPAGFVSLYNVRLLDGDTERTSTSATGTYASLSYSGLRNGYRYNFDVQARSEAYSDSFFEYGDWKRFQIKTTVQVPNPPTNVVCQDHEDRAVMLTWSAPTLPNGDIVRYHIQVWYGSNNTAAVCTTGTETQYQVPNLDPGTTYSFRVYVENEQYNSTFYGESPGSDAECKTKAAMSTSPTNLVIESTTSRGFTVKWEKPVNLFTEENYGYVLQIKSDQNVCVKEAIYRCSDCRQWGGFQTVSGLCSPDVRDQTVPKTRSELETQQTYTARLDPDILYTIYVSATNDEGLGHKANKSERTLEETPQKPLVSVQTVSAISVTLSWSIAGPRPGKTNYKIVLTAQPPAKDIVKQIEGFVEPTAVVTGLEEYWNYSLAVQASTSVGSSISELHTIITLPAAPGPVSSFVVKTAVNGNYRNILVSWRAPSILERNGVILRYSFMYNSTSKERTSLDAVTDMDHTYISTVDVTPESVYLFEVYAINSQGLSGTVTQEHVYAPAGIPENTLEEVDGVSVIADVQDVFQTRFTLSVVKEFFMQDQNGEIRATGLIACAKDKCKIDGTFSLEWFRSMTTWQIASNEGFRTYRITRDDWLTAAEMSKGRRRRSLTMVEFRVGVEDCSNTPDLIFCNGPLNPDTEYIVIAVVCTSGGCLLSDHYGPFRTLPELKCETSSNTNAVIIGVIMGVVIVILATYAAYLTVRTRQSESKRNKSTITRTRQKNFNSPLYANECFSMPISDIQPPLDSQNQATSSGETEYADLDENTRSSKSTYEKLHIC